MILLSLIMSVAMARTNCDATALDAKSRIKFPGSGYWMQAAGERYISYTGTGGMGSQIFDLEKKERVLNDDNEIDGYALPEGDLYVHPSPIRFFKLEDRIKDGQDTPVFTDEDHQGFYQSIAEPSKEGNVRNVRVLTAEGYGRIQDYKIEKKSNGDYKFTKKYRQPVEICNNLNRENIDFQIPILSRKGSMFATKDYSTNTTKLYKIAMPSGNCTEMADLGVETDKVSFSYDDENIAYSTAEQVMVNGEYQGHQKRLRVFNIETKKSRVVTGPSENVLYHGYRQDNTLMYTRNTTSNDSYYSEESELVTIDPSTTQGSQVDTKAAIEIGKAWAKDCNKDSTDEVASTVGFRLKKADCAALVTSATNLSADAKNFCTAKKAPTDSSQGGTQ